MRLDRIIMNGIYPELFSDAEAEILRERYERKLTVRTAATGSTSSGGRRCAPRSPSTRARARTASSSTG